MNTINNNIYTQNSKNSLRSIQEYFNINNNGNRNRNNVYPWIYDDPDTKAQLRGYDKSTWITTFNQSQNSKNDYCNNKYFTLTISSVLSHLYCPKCALINFKDGRFIQNIYTIQGQIGHLLIERVLVKEEELIKERNNKTTYTKIVNDLFDSLKSVAKSKYSADCTKLNISFESLWSQTEVSIRNKLADILTQDEHIPKRQFEIFLTSNALGLKGRIDILEEDQIPVEIKTGKAPVSGINYSDAIQLALYALLIENTRLIDVDIGYIYYLKTGKKHKIWIGDKVRKYALRHREEASLTFQGKNKPFGRCYKCSISDIEKQNIRMNSCSMGFVIYMILTVYIVFLITKKNACLITMDQLMAKVVAMLISYRSDILYLSLWKKSIR